MNSAGSPAAVAPTAKPKSVFLHIEKCAGSSVLTHLHAALGPGGLLHANENRHLRAPLAALLAHAPAVAGHFTFAAVAPVLPQAFAFTFLRDPVARVLSLYHFWREVGRPDAGAGQLDAQRNDLETILHAAPSQRASAWCNWQTFVLSGDTDCERPAEDMLPAALRNLEQLDFVGVSEALDEGLHALCARRGWPPPAGPLRVNVTRSRPVDTPGALRALIASRNACDAQLHAHARAIWLDQVTAAGPTGPLLQAAPAPAVREVSIADVRITGPRRMPATPNDLLSVHVVLAGRVDAEDLTVGIRITDELGLEIYGTNSRLLGEVVRVRRDAETVVTFALGRGFAPGSYKVTAAVHEGLSHLDGCHHWLEDAAQFTCLPDAPMTWSGVADFGAAVRVSAPGGVPAT